MIKVQEYRGHIRNWEELCERLGISLLLPRKEREEEILVKAYETWGYEMADTCTACLHLPCGIGEQSVVLSERPVWNKTVLLL